MAIKLPFKDIDRGDTIPEVYVRVSALESNNSHRPVLSAHASAELPRLANMNIVLSEEDQQAYKDDLWKLAYKYAKKAVKFRYSKDRITEEIDVQNTTITDVWEDGQTPEI
jgi:hypothetical protein